MAIVAGGCELVHRGVRTFRAEVRGFDNLALKHLSRRALEDQLSEVQHPDLIADLTDQRHVVFDDEDSRPSLRYHLGEDMSEVLGFGRVQTRGRFIQ